MASALITSWTAHDNSLQAILGLALRTLFIFDKNLVKLKLERRENAEMLRCFLSAGSESRFQIVVRNAEQFRRDSPRLMNLLATYPQEMTIVEGSLQLASLSDSFIIADGKHALIRFHEDHARAKVIIDEPHECRPYVRRFEEITAEGGEQISATTLGL